MSDDATPKTPGPLGRLSLSFIGPAAGDGPAPATSVSPANGPGNPVEARVVTAQPADAAVLDVLRALVAERTKKSVRLVTAVDPALLGGFVVSVGSVRLDASLFRRLEKARAALHALAPA